MSKSRDEEVQNFLNRIIMMDGEKYKSLIEIRDIIFETMALYFFSIRNCLAVYL